MQKQILIVTCFALLVIASCKKEILPPANIGFQKQFTDSTDDYCNAIVSVNDEFLFLAGYTVVNGDKDFLLMKTDLEGHLIWKKYYSISLDAEECFSIKKIGNTLLLTGYCTPNTFGTNNIELLKVDFDGNLIWQKHFGTLADDVAADVVELPNGNLFIAGNSRNFDTGTRSVYWVITDADGNVLHENHCGTSLEDGASKVILDKNNLPVMLAWTDSGTIGGRDFWLIACTDTGAIRWQKQWGHSGYEQAGGFCLMPDGGFFLTGHSSSFTEPEHDMYEARLNDTAGVKWFHHYGGAMHDGAEAAYVTTDNHLLMLGRTMSFGNGGNDFYFIETDEAGNLLSEKTFGTTNDEEGRAITVAKGNYYLAGVSYNNSSASHHVYLVKVAN